MGIEIERKYLLQGDAWRTPEVLDTAKEITQTYLATNHGNEAWVGGEPGDRQIIIGRFAAKEALPELNIPLSEEAFQKLTPNPLRGTVLTLPRGFEARIRLAKGEAILTLKGGKGLSRSEFEAVLDNSVAASILAKPENVVGAPIQKTRYAAPLDGGLIAEIDIYDGENAGLRVVEVELPDIDTAVPATSWIGREVTNADLSNASLALNPMSARSGLSPA